MPLERAVGRLDLDHIGAEIAKIADRKRPKRHSAQVEYPNLLELVTPGDFENNRGAFRGMRSSSRSIMCFFFGAYQLNSGKSSL